MSNQILAIIFLILWIGCSFCIYMFDKGQKYRKHSWKDAAICTIAGWSVAVIISLLLGMFVFLIVLALGI